jgi:F0F1-type ATP synthase assembly protein I
VEPDDNDAERGASPSDPRPRALSPADLAARQETYQGFGDTLAVAFELAITPFVFGLIGYGLDRWLGVVPLFTLVLVLFCIAGLSVRVWFDYDTRMKAHEARGPWARPLRAASRGTVTEGGG